MKVLSGQSLFDIAIQSCGGTDAAFELAVLNGLNLMDDLIPGQELALPEVVNPDIALYFKNKNIQPATLLTVQTQFLGSLVDAVIRDIVTIQSNIITSLQGQTLFDIAVQTAGSVEAAFEMALINSIGITDDLVPGTNLSPVGILNKQIAAYYRNKNLMPATGLQGEIGDDIGGIEYWAVETEFLVS